VARDAASTKSLQIGFDMFRVLIPIDSHDPQAWQLALAYANKIGEQVEGRTDFVLLVHTKQQIDRTSLANHIGTKLGKALSKGNVIQLQSSVSLQLKTLKTLGQTYNGAVVIAFFAEEKMLEVVDDLRGLAGVVVVPDLPGSADQWLNRWGAVIHGGVDQSASNFISDAVIEKALSELISMVNPVTGIGNLRDKQLANETFRILRVKGHTLEPDAIRSWAIQNGWSSDNARGLAKLSDKIRSLKSNPSLGQVHNWKGRYDHWV